MGSMTRNHFLHQFCASAGFRIKYFVSRSKRISLTISTNHGVREKKSNFVNISFNEEDVPGIWKTQFNSVILHTGNQFNIWPDPKFSILTLLQTY